MNKKNKTPMQVFYLTKKNRVFALGILLFAAIFVSGCARKKVSAQILPPARPLAQADMAQADARAHERVFAYAESLFQSRDYNKAAQAYQDYIDSYPTGSFAPAAWMKIAQIAVRQRDYETARQAYYKVLGEYPDSAMAMDARWGILDTFYREERYDALIPRLSAIASKPKDSRERVRALALLGDVYMATGEAQNALAAYTNAYKKARGNGKEVLFLKMEKVLDLLSPDQAREILSKGRGCAPLGLLWLKTARDQINGEEWGAAKATLKKLLFRCPGHARAGEARMILKSLKKVESFRTRIIGCLLPLSGPYERFGNKLLSGVELAISRYNAKHPDRGFTLTVRDTRGDQQQAVKGFTELAEKNASFIIGPMLTAEAVSDTAKEFCVPAVVFTQKQTIPDPEGYLFRNYLTLPMQADTLVSYAVTTLGLTRFAILYPDDDYGNANLNIFWDEVIAQGGIVTGVESYKSDQTDFADSIKKLAGLYYERPEPEPLVNIFADEEPQPEETDQDEEEEKPEPIIDFEVIFVPDSPQVAGLIIPQLKFYDVNDVLLMGTNLWHSQKLIDIAKTYANGAIMPDIFFLNSPGPAVKDFVSEFQNNFGADPGFLEALGYDTANLAFYAMSLPRVYSGESLCEALRQIEYNGVTGKTSFDQSGEVQKELYLLRVRRRGFEQINVPEIRVTLPHTWADTLIDTHQ